MTAPVYEDLLSMIGQTPLVRLRNVVPQGAATVWAKCEQLNPGGSVKDRIALAMLERAEADGRLQPGATVVEPTSGNTGIGLALSCSVKGYHLVLTMPESMSLERRALLEAYGAEIVLTPAERVMEGAIEAAEKVVKERGAFMPGQFDNEANPRVHEHTTAREILEQMGDDRISALISAVGTGGTVSGVGKALKEHDAQTRVIGVEPSSSPVLSGGEPGPTKIQGIGAGFIPENFHTQHVDEVRQVGDRQAYDMKLRLSREEGLLVGISAGANVHAAIDLARELGDGQHVVTFLCDTGERYFSLDSFFQGPESIIP